MSIKYGLIAALIVLLALVSLTLVLIRQRQHKLLRRTHYLELHDNLTGLVNRQMFVSRLVQVMHIAQTDKHHFSSLLKVNLDGFKRINDAGGHAAGDRLLKQVADCLHTNTRERDTVSRLGADEFLVLLVQVGNTHDQAANNAMRVAHKLRRLLSGLPIRIGNTTYHIQASFGLALVYAGVTDADTLMYQTDMAMQQAKAEGGGDCVFYHASIQHEVQKRLQLERDLHRAIGTPQLSLVVQSQVNSHGTTVGAELLMRWQHPDQGAIAPDIFIPLAEESGFIHELTRWSIQVACRLLVELDNRGIHHPISVNISPRCLQSADFASFLAAELTRTGVSGDNLIFEVTEGVWIQDIDAARNAMLTFRSLGIQFAMDDFGSGYANLAYLKHLPLAELKIDRSLVKGIPDDSNATAISNFIIVLGQQLDMRVVAEGVENQIQSQLLFNRGCSAQQGFLHAHPQSISDWLASQSQKVRPAKPD